MSERTFRAVVAAVLIGALALAAVVAFAMLQPSPSPAPTATLSPPPSASSAPAITPTPAPTPSFVFEDVGVTGVGSVPVGGTSGMTLALRFLEPSFDAIPDAVGSFTVTLTDHAGAGSTLGFPGLPSIIAPGSLGATAELVAGNVLKISIVASDRFNVELITLTGLAIRASSAAAPGSINATVGSFTGSLAGGVANVVLPSPGTVIAGP